jgi:hypothetical protein
MRGLKEGIPHYFLLIFHDNARLVRTSYDNETGVVMQLPITAQIA